MDSGSFICPCGGVTKLHHGFFGYEAAVCPECGEHWADRNELDHIDHMTAYERGARNNLPMEERGPGGLPIYETGLPATDA